MRARRTDGKHKEVLDAIRDDLGWQCMSLHAQGRGCEDILVAVPEGRYAPMWLMLEVKTVETESTGYHRYTPAQLKWRASTAGWPRITAFSGLDACAKLRAWQTGQDA